MRERAEGEPALQPEASRGTEEAQRTRGPRKSLRFLGWEKRRAVVSTASDEHELGSEATVLQSRRRPLGAGAEHPDYEEMFFLIFCFIFLFGSL
jgi:hypothetical protein